jgi:hypothetical protein
MLTVLRRLVGMWHSRQRDIDMKILWPTCRDLAPDIDTARACFALHALHDSAWLALGEDEVISFIDKLE